MSREERLPKAQQKKVEWSGSLRLKKVRGDDPIDLGTFLSPKKGKIVKVSQKKEISGAAIFYTQALVISNKGFESTRASPN